MLKKKKSTYIYVIYWFALGCHVGALVLPQEGTSLEMLPRDRGCAASSNTGGFWNWELLPRQLGCAPCKRWNPTEQNPNAPSFWGKTFLDLVSDLRLRCGGKCVMSEKPDLPLCLPTISSLSHYVIEREKYPFFYPTVLWDALRAQYPEDTGFTKRQLPPDSKTRLFTYQKISLFFENVLKKSAWKWEPSYHVRLSRSFHKPGISSGIFFSPHSGWITDEILSRGSLDWRKRCDENVVLGG